MLFCSQLPEIFNEGRPKLPAAVYYRVERDGWDELLMRGLVWIDKSGMGWVRMCLKGCSRPCMSGVCEQVGQDSVGQGSGGWDGKELGVVQ